MRRRLELATTTNSRVYRRLQYPDCGRVSRACSFGHDSWKLHRFHQDRTFGCHPAYRKVTYSGYRRNRR